MHPSPSAAHSRAQPIHPPRIFPGSEGRPPAADTQKTGIFLPWKMPVALMIRPRLWHPCSASGFEQQTTHAVGVIGELL